MSVFGYFLCRVSGESEGRFREVIPSAHVPLEKLVCIYTLTTPVLDTPLGLIFKKVYDYFLIF